MVGRFPIGLQPIGAGPGYPPTPPAVDQNYVLQGLRQYLLTVLSPGVEVVRGQDNRVPSPAASDYIVMTPMRLVRLSTVREDDADVRFTGSIAVDTLSVTAVDYGLIALGAQILGIGVLPRTTITSLGTSTGGIGAYAVSPSQTLSSRTLAAGQDVLVQPTQFTLQLDVHGDAGANNATTVIAALRSASACDWFGSNYAGVSPLYADEARQLPFINDQMQYEDRWTIEAALQYDPTLALPRQFADAVVVNPIPVDLFYN